MKSALKCTTSHNLKEKKASPVKTVTFPSDCDVVDGERALTKASKAAAMNDLSHGLPSVGTKRRRLTRTTAYRSLPGFGQKQSAATASPTKDPQPLSREDEKIVQSVVKSITDDETLSEEDAEEQEFCMLLAESFQRPGRDPLHLLSIPDEHRSDAPSVKHVPRSVPAPPTRASVLQRSRFSRFDIDIMPYERRTTMWDASEK